MLLQVNRLLLIRWGLVYDSLPSPSHPAQSIDRLNVYIGAQGVPDSHRGGVAADRWNGVVDSLWVAETPIYGSLAEAREGKS